MNGRFEGKVVIVTGAGTGLGLAAAMRLAQEGADLSLVDVNGDALNKAGEALRAAAPDTRVALTTADVAVEDEVASYVEQTIAEQMTPAGRGLQSPRGERSIRRRVARRPG